MQQPTETAGSFLSRLRGSDYSGILQLPTPPPIPYLVTRNVDQRTRCWSNRQNLEMVDTALRGWTTLVHLLPKKKNGQVYLHCVFDGAHKIEALIDFINDKLAIREINDPSWQTSPLKNYVGLTFSQLPEEVQTKVMSYSFSVNYVPDDVADDKAQLRTLWQRLNKAGTRLNGYELDIPIFRILYETLGSELSKWYETVVFPGKESARGSGETMLMQMLALTWYTADGKDRSFSSLMALMENWKAAISGDGGVEEVEAALQANQKEYQETLNRIHAIYTDLNTRHVFPAEDDAKKEWKVPTLILLGRLGRVFTDVSHYNHHANALEPILKELYATNIDDLIKTLGCKNRNAKFQKALLKHIDHLLRPFVEIVPRTFKVKQAKKAKEAQKNICPECKEPILSTDRVERDHVVPYSQGGATTVENLEVVHKHCHAARTARMNG